MAAKTLVLSMGVLYLCLIVSLIWSHVGPTTVYSVAQTYMDGRNLTRDERQKMMQRSIVNTRCLFVVCGRRHHRMR